MTILVTGGAGFIGANCVLDWLRLSDEPLINLDKRTYAGNLGNFASLKGVSRISVMGWWRKTSLQEGMWKVLVDCLGRRG